MLSQVAFLPQIRLAGSSRLGQAQDGIPYLTEFLDRSTAATMKFINALTRSMSIPKDLRPSDEVLYPEWAKRWNSDVSDQWAYTVGDEEYVFGEPIENLERYEQMAEQSVKLVDDALAKTFEIGDQIQALQKEINEEIKAISSVSPAKAKELQKQLEECQGSGISLKAVECLQGVLANVKTLPKTTTIPRWG